MFDAQKITDAVSNLEEDLVYQILDELMAAGGSDAQEAMAACQAGMKLVGDRFEAGEYFLGDLIFAGEIMEGAVQKLKSALVASAGESAGKLILCTVYGDLHDIGKNIVRSFLEASGFEVLDLGVDTPVQKIVDTAKAENIKIIALSGVLTLAIDAMKDTVDGFVEAGIRDDVKILVGGSFINEEVWEATGADAWAYFPQAGVNKCLEWAKG